MTRHEENSMKQTTLKSDEVWYVDSGASNYMMSHNEWFSYLEKPMQPRVVATGDDTSHPIANVGDVPLSHVGQKGKLMNVLHVTTITCRSDRSSTKGCNFGLRISGASSRKKAELLRKDAETGGCLSSTLVTVAPQCSQRDKKSSLILTYGTSG